MELYRWQRGISLDVDVGGAVDRKEEWFEGSEVDGADLTIEEL